jgi:hypothetical protein
MNIAVGNVVSQHGYEIELARHGGASGRRGHFKVGAFKIQKSGLLVTSFASHNSLAKRRCLPSDVSGLPTDKEITQTESVR